MQPSHHLTLGLLAAIAFASCASVPGVGINVGTSTLPVVDAKRDRKLTAEIWFDAGSSADVERFSPRPPIRTIRIARNSKPVDRTTKHPLIVISHGNWGTRFSQGWLAMSLVEAGYIVVSLSHPGTMADDRTTSGAVRLWDRARDASVVLDAILAEPAWSDIIDSNRIGFAGHSFGAFAGVVLAGGYFSPQAQLAFCKKQPNDLYCKAYSTLDSANIPQGDVIAPYRDSRFKAFFLMAPGPAQGFSAESLRAITAPVFLDAPKIDTVLSTADNAARFAGLIPSSTLVTRDAGHFTYVPECKPVLGWLLADLICSDPDDVDRRKLHQAVTVESIRFFTQALTVSAAKAPVAMPAVPSRVEPIAEPIAGEL
jgi:predicted dienelactone hydrolase